jgi:Pyridoxamine 5'-phosphate oxidase
MTATDWPDAIDEVIDGDLTAAVAYTTPAGGAVVTAVAPVGLRDRGAGTVSFTTSLGFGRKIERLRRDPRIALAYHAREHGFSSSPLYVLVQGRATIVTEPDREYLEKVLRPRVIRHMGEPKTGPFWDRWLSAYYSDRVPVHVEVERIVAWPDLTCAGEPEVHGEPLAPGRLEPQDPPKNGTGPRVDAERAAKRLSAHPHLLLAYRGADGYPVVVPVQVAGADGGGIELDTADGLMPPGGRRAGVLAHDYRPKLIGLSARQHTGWLEVDGERALYAPHTETGFRAPANKTLLLLANG